MGFSSWTETIMLSMLFVVLAGLVIGGMNTVYDKNFAIGLDTSAIEEDGSFASYTVTAQGQVEGGEADQTDSGLSLSSSWAIAKGVYSTVWTVISGAWISIIISDMLGWPSSVALVLRVLFLISLIFAVIKLFFKVLDV